MDMRRLILATLSIAIPGIAYAGVVGLPLPEPETIALLGIGAVALVIARWRKKK